MKTIGKNLKLRVCGSCDRAIRDQANSLNVYWKDRYGNLKPLRLQPGCSASAKILFRHKHFYLGVD